MKAIFCYNIRIQSTPVKTQKKSCRLRIITSVIVLFFLCSLVRVDTSFAASSWSPTLLVNTEAFQIIDDSNDTADIKLRFGGSISEEVYWNRASALFQFTDDVHVEGNVTSSGTLIVSGTGSIKAETFKVNSDQSAGDTVLVFGSDTANETLKFLNLEDRFEFSDDLHATGNITASGGIVVNTASRIKANLTVSSTMSGAAVDTYNLNASKSATTGSILVSRTGSAPQWAQPMTSMVWFIDGALFVTATGAAVITMPFGLTVSTGSLRINVAPTGADVIANITRNGQSIYTTAPRIVANTKHSKNGTFAFTHLSGGTVVSVSIDQVGSNIAGSGLTIMLTGRRHY